MIQLIPPDSPQSFSHDNDSSSRQPKIKTEYLRSYASDRGRVVILIDGANLFYAASHLGIEVDYVKLLRCLTYQGKLIHAFFYTGIDGTNDKQRGFLNWMRCNGYRVVMKELVQFADGSKKANLNVEIAIDMLALAKHCDTVVLVSGNGDLAYAANAIAYQGVQIEIVSLRNMTSDRLISVADYYLDLETIRSEIQVAQTDVISKSSRSRDYPSLAD
jgi:uncharacterized LabA/DUF88 family protein